MATSASSKSKKTDEIPSDTINKKGTDGQFDFSAITIQAAPEMPKQNRKAVEPNPLEGAVKASVDAGYKPMQFGPIPTEMVNKAKNLMHRAAREAGHGLTIRETAGEEGIVTLVYCAKKDKKERKYTIDQVRAWVEENYSEQERAAAGYASDKRVPPGVISAYRQANGIDGE